jgi:hypothetical protein
MTTSEVYTLWTHRSGHRCASLVRFGTGDYFGS